MRPIGQSAGERQYKPRFATSTESIDKTQVAFHEPISDDRRTRWNLYRTKPGTTESRFQKSVESLTAIDADLRNGFFRCCDDRRQLIPWVKTAILEQFESQN